MNTKATLSSFVQVLKWCFFLFFIVVILIIIIGHYNESFDFDIVGSTHQGFSSTKEEAIHRNTFICDVKLPTQTFKISETRNITLKSGFIEQSWTSGFWHWTTYKDTGVDIDYHIVLNYNKGKTDTTEWRIINPANPNEGYLQLQDFRNQLTGNIISLPVNDTLRYDVLKRDTIDFHPNNIDGILILVLQRKLKM